MNHLKVCRPFFLLRKGKTSYFFNLPGAAAWNDRKILKYHLASNNVLNNKIITKLTALESSIEICYLFLNRQSCAP